MKYEGHGNIRRAKGNELHKQMQSTDIIHHTYLGAKNQELWLWLRPSATFCSWSLGLTFNILTWLAWVPRCLSKLGIPALDSCIRFSRRAHHILATSCLEYDEHPTDLAHFSLRRPHSCRSCAFFCAESTSCDHSSATRVRWLPL